MNDYNLKLLINEFQRLIQVYRIKKTFSYKELSKVTEVSAQMLVRYEKNTDMDIPVYKLFIVF